MNEYAFSKLHPITIFLYFVSLFLVNASFTSPVIVSLTFFAMILLRIKTDGVGRVLKQIILSVPLLLFCTVINALFNHRGDTPYLYINDVPITLEVTANGFFTGIMLISLIMLFAFYNNVMEQHKFLYLFSKIAPMTSLMISMVFRYIPLCMSIFREIYTVEKTLYNKKMTFFGRIIFCKVVFLSCVSKSLEYTIGASLSMKSKGYGVKTRSNAAKFQITNDDIAVISITVLLDAIIIWFLLSKRYAFAYYNKMSEMSIDVGLLVFVALYCIPFIVQFVEMLRWKLSQRKI